MQKIGQQGVGALCAELMKRVREKQGAGGPVSDEMMESVAAKHDVKQQVQTASNEEEDDVDDT